MGRLSMAARQLREIAETVEKEGNAEECIMFYEQAADLYTTENSTAEANKCNLKIAQYSAELERYGVARDIYEAVARTCVDNNLLKFSAKGHLLHAGLCALCYMETPAIQEKLERYKDVDVNFEGSRECKLLEELTAAFEARDSDAFTTAVAEYDSLTRLDAWKTAMLVCDKFSYFLVFFSLYFVSKGS